VGDTFKDRCVEGSRQWEGKVGKDRAREIGVHETRGGRDREEIFKRPWYGMSRRGCGGSYCHRRNISGDGCLCGERRIGGRRQYLGRSS